MFKRTGTLLLKRFNSYFLPTILMSMALSMSIVVDGIIVGNLLGQDAMAAVNLGLPLMQFFAAIFVFFGLGGSILSAWHLGRHENTLASAVFSLSVISLIIASLVCAVPGLIFSSDLAGLLAGSNSLANLLQEYITPLLYGAPVLLIVSGLSYFVRVDGRPGLASAILIVANIANVICVFLFIHLLDNISGAALATVTGYTLGLLLSGFYLISPMRVLRFSFKSCFRMALFSDILRSGLPGGLSIGLIFIKLFCLNMLVLSVAGKNGMVAFSVCIATLSLASMFITGASQTMMPIMGVLYGEGDYAGMKIIFRRSLTTLMLCTLVLIALLQLFSGQLLLIFGIHGQDEHLVSQAVRYYTPSLIWDAFIMLMIYYSQTIRKLSLAVKGAILHNLLILLPCAWLMSRWLGLTGIWLSFSISGILTTLAILILVHRESMHSGVSGLLMLPANNLSSCCMDVSLNNTMDEAVGLSAAVTDFCNEHGIDPDLALRTGIIVEEMAVNIVRYSGQNPGSSMLDVRMCITDEEVRISLRDAGRPFSPLDFQPQASEPTVSGISLVRILGAQITYSYALGFNNTCVILQRTFKKTCSDR